MKHTYFLLTLGLLGVVTAASAQTLTNSGAQLSISSGTTLYVEGGFSNTAGSTLLNNGTLQVTGDVTNAGTVDATSTGTLTLSGTANQALNMGGQVLPNLTVDKSTGGGNTVTVPADLTIKTQLLLTNGSVQTTSATKVVLQPGALLTGEAAGRYVKGNLQMQLTSVNGNTTVTFPDASTLAVNSNNLGTVTLLRTAGLNTAGVSYATNGSYKGIDRVWQLTTTSAPASNKPVTLTVSWLAENDNGNTNLTSARVWSASSMAGVWSPASVPGDASSRTISVTTPTPGFFTVSNAANPLPVELTAFTAERRGTDALLRWTTAQEKNNDHFDVEVSLDGLQFRRLGAVAGQGTTTSRHDYEYTDPQIARYGASLLYYRLRQVDTDGQQSLSPVRTVALEAGSFVAQALPNPFGETGLQVTIRTAAAGPATLSLHDAVGRVLISQKHELPIGGGTVQLDGAGKLATGVYFLTVRQDKQVATLKVVRE